MIGISLTIPYRTQIGRADPGLDAELASACAAAAADFGAGLGRSDRIALLTLGEGEGACRLRATELLRRLAGILGPLGPRLHGWVLGLDILPGPAAPEELENSARRLWLLAGRDGVFASAEAAGAFAGYLRLAGEEGIPRGGPRRVSGFPAAEASLPPGFALPRPSRSYVDRLGNELERAFASPRRPLFLPGPGSLPGETLLEAVRLRFGDPAAVLRIGAGAGSSPFAPFVAALAGPGARDGESPAFRLAGRSPFRGRFSPALEAEFGREALARLRDEAGRLRTGGLPPLMLFDRIDRFPGSSVRLAIELAAALSREGIVSVFAGEEPTAFLETLSPRLLPPPRIGEAEFSAPARLAADAAGAPGAAAALANLAAGDGFRLALGARLLASGRQPAGDSPTAELAEACLASLPPEFSEFLFALALGEEGLPPDEREGFLEAAGFGPGLRTLAGAELARLGFLRAGEPLAIARPEALPARGSRLLPDGGRAIEEVFIERILALHARGSIHPSLALHARVTATLPATGLFHLDCVAAEALHGPSLPEGGSPGSDTLSLFSVFLARYAEADGTGAARVLEELDASLAGALEAERERGRPTARGGRGAEARGGTRELQAAIATLARAFDEYARGEAQAAAIRSRPALIALHGLGARGMEARAHRLLGLAALAQRQVQEGADYLANALDIASAVQDPFECFHAAWAGAGAELVLGDLERAESRLREAEAWARRSIRPEWLGACDFFSGRLALELGRYAEAVEAFSRAEARAASRAEEGSGTDPAATRASAAAARRAAVWRGRALSLGGKKAEARAILEEAGRDAEALWFLGELEAFGGAWEEAAERGIAALATGAEGGYLSADALRWDSGFAGIEGRCLGFARGTGFLGDQVAAFAEFAAAMAGRAGAGAAPIAARTREERIAQIHPQAHLYHYYCYRIQRAAGSGALDASTTLSKAFKALQVRSARIEGSALKDRFLEGNRWNRELMDAARAEKLI